MLPSPAGDTELTFDQYTRKLSATTGSALVFCDRNARKVHYVLANIEEVIGGLTRGLPLEALETGVQHCGWADAGVLPDDERVRGGPAE